MTTAWSGCSSPSPKLAISRRNTSSTAVASPRPNDTNGRPDQRVNRLAEQAAERGVGIRDHAIRQGNQNDEVGGLIEQGMEALQTIKVLP